MYFLTIFKLGLYSETNGNNLLIPLHIMYENERERERESGCVRECKGGGGGGREWENVIGTERVSVYEHCCMQNLID